MKLSFFDRLIKRSKKGNIPEADYKLNLAPQKRDKKYNLIGNNYEVHGELGHGGFGVVYKVYSCGNHEVFALKTFLDEYLEDSETRRLFHREASVWVALERHPYLVRAHLVDEISGRLYIAMEFITPNEQGLNTLEGYLEHQPPNLTQSLRWAIQFCYGMEYAYSKGVRCHRDIKPANIMITTDKTVKISDFGLAGVLTASKASKIIVNMKHGKVGLSGSIMDGKGCGTSTHMPPEQFTNAADCDQRSDIYAFGVVLYQMASGGRLPFLAALPRDGSAEEQVRFSREMYMLHCKASIPKLDSPLFPMICRCLEKEQSKRYSTFKELRADLEPLLKHQTGETVKPPELKELDTLELLRKGVSLDRLGRFDEEIDCYDMALEINPKFADAWNNKGNSLNNLGRFDEAIKCSDKALEINPQFVESWNNKGNSLDSLGRFNEAIKCYNKALSINPQYEIAWNNKGNSFNRLGRFDEAIKCFNKASEINPRFVEAWNNKGDSFYNLGRFDEAIKCYNNALSINPQCADAWCNKGSSFNNLTRFDEALKCFDKVFEINPQHHEAWFCKGFSLHHLGRFDEALKCCDKVLEINPQYTLAWYNKACAEDRLGRKQDAARSNRKFIKLAPSTYAQYIQIAKQRLRELEEK